MFGTGALTHARSQADAYLAVARSWQVTAALAVDAMERSHQKHLASNPAGSDILDSILQWNDVVDRALKVRRGLGASRALIFIEGGGAWSSEDHN